MVTVFVAVIYTSALRPVDNFTVGKSVCRVGFLSDSEKLVRQGSQLLPIQRLAGGKILQGRASGKKERTGYKQDKFSSSHDVPSYFNISSR
jgi:hypothetical protein